MSTPETNADGPPPRPDEYVVANGADAEPRGSATAPERLDAEETTRERLDLDDDGPADEDEHEDTVAQSEADAADAGDGADMDEDADDGALPGDDTPQRPGLEKARPQSVSEEHLKSVLESLVFVSNAPVSPGKLARVAKAPVKDVRRLLTALAEDYGGRGIELVELASGWQFRSAAANAPFVRDIVAKKPVRLSRAQLETLSIAAYRQPLTKPELEEIRGVDSSSALKVLLDRGLLKILGRKDEPGRPLLYGTSPHFLEFFGLRSLDELPTLKEFSELSDESKALFARKTGEDIETIGEIDFEKQDYDEAEFEDPVEGEGADDGAEGGSAQGAEDAAEREPGDDPREEDLDDDDLDDDDLDDDDLDDEEEDDEEEDDEEDDDDEEEE